MKLLNRKRICNKEFMALTEFTRMELVDENLVIDLIENKKLSYEQASSVLEERFPGLWGLSSQSVGRFCSEKTISSRVSTEK